MGIFQDQCFHVIVELAIVKTVHEVQFVTSPAL